MRRWTVFSAVVAFLLFANALCSGAEILPCAVNQQVMADCDIGKGPCTKKVGAFEVTLEIGPRPVRAMKENSFAVRMRPDPHTVPGKITIDLAMPGMFMGNNTVMLKREASGLYAGTGIIPRCPSGRRLWKATVNLPEGGKVEYLFDVVN